MANTPRPCFVCDADRAMAGDGVSLVLGRTPYSNTELPTKIGQIMGDNYMVIVTHEDMLCKRCFSLINHLDKLEFDVNIVKKAISGYVKKKYNLQDEPPLIADAADVAALQSESNEQNLQIRTPNQSGTSTDVSKIKISSVESLSERNKSNSGTKKSSSVTNKSTSDANKSHSVASHSSKVPNGVLKNMEKKKIPIKKGDTNIHRCKSCKFTCGSIRLLLDHMKTHPRRTYFKCSECSRQFNTREEAQNHIEKDHNVNGNEEVHSRKKGRKEQNSVPAEAEYKCEQCSCKYLSKDDYDEHVKTHSTAVVHECAICKKRFKSSAFLLQHMKTHKVYKCGICGVSFKVKSNLMMHFSIHKKGEKTVDLQTLLQKPDVSQFEDAKENEGLEEGEETPEARVDAGAEREKENVSGKECDQVEEMLKALHSDDVSAVESQKDKGESSQNGTIYESGTSVLNVQSETMGAGITTEEQAHHAYESDISGLDVQSETMGAGITTEDQVHPAYESDSSVLNVQSETMDVGITTEEQVNPAYECDTSGLSVLSETIGVGITTEEPVNPTYESDISGLNVQSEPMDIGSITEEQVNPTVESILSENIDSNRDSLNEETQMSGVQETGITAAEDNEKIDSLPDMVSDLLENIKSLQGNVDTSAEKMDMETDDIGIHLEQTDVLPGTLGNDLEDLHSQLEKSGR